MVKAHTAGYSGGKWGAQRMNKPKAQAVPDPAATVAAQSASNKDTAITQAQLNSVNQVTPDGSLTYSQNGTWADGTPRLTATTALNPTQQQSYDQQQQLDLGTNTLANQQLGRISDAVSTPFSYAGMPAAPTASDAGRQQVIDALYGESTKRLDPQFQQSEEALRTRLANQGINDPNSDAYKTAMQDFNFSKNDAYGSARNSAIAAGGDEQTREFGLQGTERDRAINESLQQRNQPLNEAAALLGTSSVAAPTFVNTPQTSVGQTDVIGANALSSNVAMNNMNQKNAYNSALIGALAGAGGTAAGLAAKSDRRLKQNIQQLGTLPLGIGLYSFTYRNDPQQTAHIGVMADEVQTVMPEAVTTGEDGFMMVNYSKLGLEGLVA